MKLILLQVFQECLYQHMAKDSQHNYTTFFYILTKFSIYLLQLNRNTEPLILNRFVDMSKAERIGKRSESEKKIFDIFS